MLYFLYFVVGFCSFLFANSLNYNEETEKVTPLVCNTCGNQVKFLRRCQHCMHAVLNVISFLGAFLSGFICCVFIWLVLGEIGYHPIVLAVIAACGVIIFVTDCKYYMIPDSVHFVLMLAGFFSAYKNQVLFDSILSSFVFFGFSWIIAYLFIMVKKRVGLGFGDVKFFAAAGSFLPIQQLSLFLLLSGLIGIFMALLWRYCGKKYFPFGPALFVALFVLLRDRSVDSVYLMYWLGLV